MTGWGFFDFSGKKNYVVLVLKTNPKPKVLTLRLSHIPHASLSLSLSLTHLELLNLNSLISLCLSQALSGLCLTLYTATLSALFAQRHRHTQAEIFFFSFFLCALLSASGFLLW